MTDQPPMRIRYRNWRGEERWRTVTPLWVWYGSTDWHPKPQWLLHARDAEDNAQKDFAFSGIREVEEPA